MPHYQKRISRRGRGFPRTSLRKESERKYEVVFSDGTKERIPTLNVSPHGDIELGKGWIVEHNGKTKRVEEIKPVGSEASSLPDFMYVREIPYDKYQFVSDSQDVEPIKKEFRWAKDYDSFFVPKEDLERGEITHVYGIEGIVPDTMKRAALLKQ